MVEDPNALSACNLKIANEIASPGVVLKPQWPTHSGNQSNACRLELVNKVGLPAAAAVEKTHALIPGLCRTKAHGLLDY